MAPTNNAAWLVAINQPLEIKAAPYTSPGENEIVVKNAAIAINPVDWFLQAQGKLVAPWIKHPFIIGDDVAGTVVEVGTSVTRFKPGDRVLGHAVSMDQRSNKSSEGAFQNYTVLRTNLTSHIPDSLSFEQACVLPLGLSTASTGLFMKDCLGLDLPTSTTAKYSKGKTVLIWGGSTSVGCNAIQLAVAAGYEVISTSSPKNHALLKKLGASHVLDYKSSTVIADIKALFQTRTSAGAYAIGPGSLAACIEILSSVPKGRKFVAQATFDLPSQGFPKRIWDWPAFGAGLGYIKVTTTLNARRGGVDFKFLWGSDNMVDEVGRALYEDFLPEALREGRFVAEPRARVVGCGLEFVQEALEINKKGVSAEKVVVTL